MESRKRKLEKLGNYLKTKQVRPPQLNDPGNFTIPCTIGHLSFDNILCNLSESVNVMSFSTFWALGIEMVKSIRMLVNLADRSTKRPL